MGDHLQQATHSRLGEVLYFSPELSSLKLQPSHPNTFCSSLDKLNNLRAQSKADAQYQVKKGAKRRRKSFKRRMAIALARIQDLGILQALIFLLSPTECLVPGNRGPD